MEGQQMDKAIATSRMIAHHAVASNPKEVPDSIFTGAHGSLVFAKVCDGISFHRYSMTFVLFYVDHSFDL